jgi:UDP-N-acetyl-2-amino-2-deoxyglucuronate dehydrogenase
MSEKIRFAIVGAGFIGRRHASMIQNNPEATLVAMADTNPAQSSVITDQFKVPFFNSIEELLVSDLQFDVVNICTPNNYHASQALQALQRNCHVVIEKPMALAKDDCERVIRLSEQTGKKVFCVMQNRYSPPSRWLKELVGSGKLGKINFVNVNCFWNRDERYYKASSWKGTMQFDGGTLYTQFSHFIDTIFWLFGDIKEINARFKNFNHANMIDFEDSGMVNFEFVDGGSGSFNYTTSCWDTNFESSITIIGEHGSVKVGGQYMNKVEYCHIRDYTMPELEESSPANDYGHYKGSAANHHFVIANVIDTLLGRSVATTNATEGLRVVDIIERIYSFR